MGHVCEGCGKELKGSVVTAEGFNVCDETCLWDALFEQGYRPDEITDVTYDYIEADNIG